jgi:hypothetical protein
MPPQAVRMLLQPQLTLRFCQRHTAFPKSKQLFTGFSNALFPAPRLANSNALISGAFEYRILVSLVSHNSLIFFTFIFTKSSKNADWKAESASKFAVFALYAVNSKLNLRHFRDTCKLCFS